MNVEAFVERLKGLIEQGSDVIEFLRELWSQSAAPG